MTLFQPKKTERRSISFQDVWGSGADVIQGSAEDRALTLVPVYASTRLIADAVASLPIDTYRQIGPERSDQIESPRLIKDPTRFGTSYDWVYRAMTSLLLQGNGYGLATERDGMGFATQVEWLHPGEVSVVDNRAVLSPRYRWLGKELPPDDMLHVPAYVLPGRVEGLSPIKHYATTVDVGLLAQQFGRDFFKDGAHPSALLKNAKPTDEDGAKRVKARFKDAIRGREPAVMTGGWEYEAIQVSPDESQFLLTTKMTATQIAAIYGIAPERVGGESGDSKTYKTIEQDAIQFVQFTLRPWVTRLEKAVSGLLPERQFVRFNVDAMIRSDLITRYRAHMEAISAGWRNVDEIREIEDLPPLPDGAGQKFLWPPRRAQLGQVEMELGVDDDSGRHDGDDLIEHQAKKEALEADEVEAPDGDEPEDQE